MIYQPESFYSSTLTAAITASQTSIGVTTAPNITSGYMVIEASSSNREIIKYTGVTGTTLTGCVRGLASYGSNSSGGTGTAHPAGVEIANKDVHYYYAQYYDFLMGTSATGANTMMIGDGGTCSGSNRLWKVPLSSYTPFWGISSNGRGVISEDGINSYVISSGGGGLAAGDGISIIAGSINVSPLSTGGIRISANKLAVNYGQGISATSANEIYTGQTTHTHGFYSHKYSATIADGPMSYYFINCGFRPNVIFGNIKIGKGSKTMLFGTNNNESRWDVTNGHFGVDENTDSAVSATFDLSPVTSYLHYKHNDAETSRNFIKVDSLAASGCTFAISATSGAGWATSAVWSITLF